MCAKDHQPGDPHDYQSIFYQVRFKMKYNRDPTWHDAMAHCKPYIQECWKLMLGDHGVCWDDHELDEPIAEPYAESTGGQDANPF